MQRFSLCASWEDAERDSVGYESVPLSGLDASNYPQQEMSGNALGVVAAFGVALAYLKDKENMGGAIRVVDFGGADGRYADLVSCAFPSMQFDWIVVETPRVVESMQPRTRRNLAFATDLALVLEEPADISFASAAINYVRSPVPTVNCLLKGSSLTILARLPLWPTTKHEVAVQRTQRKPFEISYPTWFFSEEDFMHEIRDKAEVLLDFICPEDKAYFAGHYNHYRGLVLASDNYRGAKRQ